MCFLKLFARSFARNRCDRRRSCQAQNQPMDVLPTVIENKTIPSSPGPLHQIELEPDDESNLTSDPTVIPKPHARIPPQGNRPDSGVFSDDLSRITHFEGTLPGVDED